ncbi:hypothetical protein BOVMAS05_11540 [Streptococcus uberis]
MFKAMRILVLKFLNFRNPKAWRLVSLMSLLVVSQAKLETLKATATAAEEAVSQVKETL